MDDPQAASAAPDEGGGEGAGAGEGRKIMLDMTDPQIADAFANCEEGEQLTVERKDDTEIVLAYAGGAEAEAEADPGSEGQPDGEGEPEARPRPAGDAQDTRALPAGDDTLPGYLNGANSAVKKMIGSRNKR